MVFLRRFSNKRTSIQRIMALNIIVLFSVILIFGVIGYLEIQVGKETLRKEAEHLKQDKEVWADAEKMERITEEIHQIHRLIRKAELEIETAPLGDGKAITSLLDQLGQLKTQIQNLQKSWSLQLQPVYFDRLWEDLLQLEKVFREYDGTEKATSDGWKSLRQKGREGIKQVSDSCYRLSKHQQKRFKAAKESVRANGESLKEHITNFAELLIGLEQRFFASITFISLVIIILQILFFILLRSRLRSLTEITSKISQEGNLSERVRWVSTDEIGLLAQSFNRMLERLQLSQEEAFANKTFLDNVIQSLLNALLVVGLDGKIRNVNPALLALLRVKREEVVHRPLESIFLQLPDELCFLERIENSKSNILFQEQEHTLVRMDGSQLTVLLSSSVIRGQAGDAEGIVCVAQDISVVKKMEDQQKYLEEQLRQSQKMEAIGTLAGGIAHDFNNILSTMQGFTWLLMADKPVDSEERDYLEEIYQAGERAASLIQQILTFSRVDSQEMKPLRLSLLVKEALRFMRSTLPATLEIVQKISANCDPILANPTQIHQIVINLCTNAVHAMKGKTGHLEVEISSVNSNDHPLLKNEYSDTTFVRLKIADTGQGIPLDDRKRIFEPFFTTKEVGEGTGLGLSVVHGIVKGHNARIFVDSELGCGTTFEVFFPALTGDVGLDVEDEWLVPQKGGEHLLIVEDEISLSRFYEIALLRLGYKVSTATNANEALELFQQKKNEVDLVLTDQAMPGMTGVELSRELLTLNANLPIILFTGYKESSLKNEVEGLNIKFLLEKPVSVGVLTHHIREVFDQIEKPVVFPDQTERLGESLSRQQSELMVEEIVQKDGEFGEIVPIFIRERQQELLEIEEAVQNGAYEKIYMIGHKLQGAAEVFGFTTAVEIGQILKEAAMKNEDEMIQKKVKALKDYLDQLEKDFNT